MYSTSPNLHPHHAQKPQHSSHPSHQPSRSPSPVPLPLYQQTSPDIAAEFANLNIRDTDRVPECLPQPEACAAHLKLLEAFHELIDDISSSDGLFDLNDRDVPITMPPKSRAVALQKLAQKRWAVYTARAVDRFAKWWYMSLPSRPYGFIRMNEFDVNGPVQDCFDDPTYAPIMFTPDNLPPLDVLMVWHTFMLNPACFVEDCVRQGKMSFWNAGMPWRAITSSIDSHSFVYNPGLRARQLWESKTGSFWDGLYDAPTRSISCVLCKSPIDVPWTTTGQALRFFVPGGTDASEVVKSEGFGYADPKLDVKCQHCGVDNNHDALQVQKILHDVNLLLKDNVPMPGTVLSAHLRVEHCDSEAGISGDADLFLNRLIRCALDHKFLTMPSSATSLADRPKSIAEIRDAFGLAINDRQVIKALNNGKSGQITPQARRAVRVMMSRYWGNASPFALDLTSAVLRQGVFVQKMHDIDWLHSPTLLSTMSRLVIKYSRWLYLLKDAQHMAVPTLDVDLAWHTHQLNPYSYYTYSVAQTSPEHTYRESAGTRQSAERGRFIDHDDKVAEVALNDAFIWTSKTYQKLYNEPYSMCTCWYCEAVRESHTSTTSRLLGDHKDIEAQLPPYSTDPDHSPHISTHNAVRPGTDNVKYLTLLKKQKVQLQRDYEKACKRAAKHGRQVPQKPSSLHEKQEAFNEKLESANKLLDLSDNLQQLGSNCLGLSGSDQSAGSCVAGTCGGGMMAVGNCGDGGGMCGGGGSSCGGGGSACGGGGGGASACGGGGGGGC